MAIQINPHQTKMWRMDIAEQTVIVVKDSNSDGFYIRTQFGKKACETYLEGMEMESLYKWLGEQLTK